MAKEKVVSRKKITHRFYFIGASLITVVAAICFAFFAYDESVIKKRIREALLSENQRVVSRFDDSLSYTKHIMRYIGNQIQRNDAAKNYKFINQLLISYRVPTNDILAWSTFSWVDNNFHLLISSNEGIDLKNFGDLSKRDYIPRTVENPETLQFGSPVHGVKSNLWSIPIGYGIKNKEGKYLGAIVTGVVIDGLKKKLDEGIKNERITFAIIETNSSSIITLSDDLLTSAVHKSLKKVSPNQQELFSYADRFYYKKLPNYPYAIITFYSDEDSYSRWLVYVLLISFVIFLVGFPLILFERKLVTPIKKLAKIAEDISSGREPKYIDTSGIEEIDHLTKQLKTIQKYEADLLKAKNVQSNFFLNMSHELRTPLTGVISFAELMTKEAYGTLQKEYSFIANQIYSSGKHLLTLIDNLLNFSKMKHGKMELQKENFAIVEEIQEAVNKISPEAEKKNIQIKIIRKCAEELMRADRTMFQSVMLNLLSNAIKFSHNDSEIEISIQVNDQKELEIIVLDHGIGIKDVDLEIILEEYGQAQDGYKNHPQKGTGLGLPIVQKIIALHGGKFVIESIHTKETKAIITLPNLIAKA